MLRGEREQALRNGDRNSLPRLRLLERGIISEEALRQWLGDTAGLAPATT
ncbi:MAG: hypothetical protein WD136_06500 [Cyanobium sp.]